MHAGAQRVLQYAPRQLYPIVCLSAEKGPFALLAQNEWDSARAMKCLKQQPSDESNSLPYFIKLRGIDRKQFDSESLPSLIQQYLDLRDT